MSLRENHSIQEKENQKILDVDHKRQNHDGYHPVTNLLEGTKRITNSLYHTSGLGNIHVVDEKVKTLGVLSDQYLNKCATVIDSNLDSAIQQSKRIVKLTKKGLKRFSDDEKLLIELVKAWCALHWSEVRNGVMLSLHEFIAMVDNQGELKLRLDKIKSRIGVFYDIASGAWSRITDRNGQSTRRVILEIIANSLCTFNNIKDEKPFITELVNFGEAFLEENLLDEAAPDVNDFVNKVKNAAGDNLNGDKLKEGIYDELGAKFFNVLLHFRKVLLAQSKLNQKVQTSRWLGLIKYGGDSAFRALENLVYYAHDKVVDIDALEHEEGEKLRNGLKAGENGDELQLSLRPKGPQGSYLDRTREMLRLLNQMRIVTQRKLPAPHRQVMNLLKRLISLGRDLAGMLSLGGAKLFDQIYLPVSDFVTTRIIRSQDLIRVQLFISDHVKNAVKALEENPNYQAMKKYVVVKYQEGQIKLAFRRAQMKDIQHDMNRFVNEVKRLMKQQDLPMKKLPSRVYGAALEIYKQRQKKGLGAGASSGKKKLL